MLELQSLDRSRDGTAVIALRTGHIFFQHHRSFELLLNQLLWTPCRKLKEIWGSKWEDRNKLWNSNLWFIADLKSSIYSSKECFSMCQSMDSHNSCLADTIPTSFESIALFAWPHKGMLYCKLLCWVFLCVLYFKPCKLSGAHMDFYGLQKALNK